VGDHLKKLGVTQVVIAGVSTSAGVEWMQYARGGDYSGDWALGVGAASV
jgi:hypothetical protein